MTEYGLVIHLTSPIAAPTVGALYEQSAQGIYSTATVI